MDTSSPATESKKPDLPSAENVGKWLAIAISIIGIYAWAGGQAYDIGYWEVFGWDGAIIKPSAQEMAFNGLIGPFHNWFWAALFLLMLGVVGLATEFLSGRQPRSRPTTSNSNETGGQQRGMDALTVMFFGGSIVSAILLACAVLIPLSLWVVSGMTSGRDSATQDICSARVATFFPTKIVLADGKILNGLFLERSDRLSVLIDQTNVHVVTVGDAPRVIDSTDLRRVRCTPPGK